MTAKRAQEIRGAVIAALVAALVSAAAATAGTVYVTSKDIRNGTVRMVDLSPALQAKLVSELRVHLVTQQLDVSADGHLAVAEIPCPDGEVVLGGGIYTGRSVSATYAYPQFDDSSWVVGGFNHDGRGDNALTGRVICARGSAALLNR